MQPIAFGTDGVRAAAGEWPLTEEGARLIGRGVAALTGGGRVVVGRDTRESGEWLTRALIEGLVEGGATALDGGVLPTAAVSCAVVANDAAAGVVITASHNPWTDNGVKVLGPDGKKLPEAAQSRLEGLFSALLPLGTPGMIEPLGDPAEAWRAAMPRLDLAGVRVLLDCANGAAAPHAPAVLRDMGAEVVERGCEPDGRNINAGVGALHPPADLAGCDVGICLDGDADRLLLIDPSRGILDGDDVLWLLAQGAGGPVVGTVMSNGGLEAALGGRLARAAVGDANVAAEMARTGASFGAEPSGHVLFADGLPTGDGLYAALRVLRGPRGRPRLPLPVGGWERWPVASRNLRFTGARRPLAGLSAPQEAEAAGHRVIVRYSGTEPLLRIHVEGQDAAAWVQRIADELLGAGA